MNNNSRDNSLYLGQILERDMVEYGSNNLIVSPTGSGKTYHMMNDLRKVYKGKTLMLVSTSSLKDALSGHKDIYTTRDIKEKGEDKVGNGVYLMSYAEFGEKVAWNNKFINEFRLILCDEIHSLVEYYSYERAHSLGAAIKELFAKHDDKTIFYYTATTARLDEFIDKTYGDLYENVRIFDYARDKDIVRYRNISTVEIFGIDEMEDSLLNLKEMREYRDSKGFVYNERINGMGKIKDMLSEYGFSSIEIWSVNNRKYEMSPEQLRVRQIMLAENKLPDEYDFVIMNGSMREGWELKDDRVKVAVLNTNDETDRIQARGRLRGDLALLITRAEGGRNSVESSILIKERELSIVEKVLGKELDSDDRDEIVQSFKVRNGNNGRIVKWPTISKTLTENGYKIEEKRVRRDGKQTRVQTITRVVEKAAPSVESRSRHFLRQLGLTKFSEVNNDMLKKYVGNERTAYSHMKSSFKRFVGEEGWTSRKFADVTYLLARDKRLFVGVNYVSVGLDYSHMEDIEILEERAKYEKSAVRLLEIERDKKDEIAKSQHEELLKYMASQLGVNYTDYIDSEGSEKSEEEIKREAEEEEERLMRYLEKHGGLQE